MLKNAGEESLRRGQAAGKAARFGALPSLLETRWPDKAAALLDVGYVAVLVDRIPLAYIAPVTAPAMFYQPLDSRLARPLSAGLRATRLVVAAIVVTASASVVALMNYHQEMMPTPFLLALAASREQEALPILLVVLFLETVQQIIREIGFHLPARIGPGNALVVGELSLLILAQSGIIGPFPAGISVISAFLGLGFLSHEILYTTRFWSYAFIVGAGMFGFFGVAGIWFILVAYLTQARSFGVPFLGETGMSFTAEGRSSSHVEGGAGHAKQSWVW